MPRKTVLLYADGDFERLSELRTRVGIAERNAVQAEGLPRRLGDDDSTSAEVEAARAEYDAFVDVAAERAEEWVVESIGHEDWRDLLLAHPMRKTTEAGPEGPVEVDHPVDAEWGFNVETFGKALLLWADPEDETHRTIQKAGDVALGGLARRVKRLSAGQFETLWATAYALNTGGVTDPKSGRYSLGAAKSDET
ncbi:hypothetical protein CFH99_07770 [Nocardioides aromaticivorans]|uniref:Uncharacterized protein n=1 Tax=Nocardioides aromaticivorans TaxID=200618 RepID=A0ABX7PHX7_9ACTN|nr:hypothetical protein [Nocardioides aromaticivorans]QSR25520.1 hypothetical protein CFH99_07770 [Nocardioides aromaticivorans]